MRRGALTAVGVLAFAFAFAAPAAASRHPANVHWAAGWATRFASPGLKGMPDVNVTLH